ncbi:regulatory protein, tetR family [Microbacterium azadirachtae]|uniref:Regulatory protein, tetR family n=1 Tax=Microbacterium azadirachtae TaxID=582680 RepID=A0A1I6HCL9_9MICO|nr:TetR/AcrR family transcriptional regulator [Microbacterium azadirachtae]SFR52100.1 regulatory protein, tetR family [Microbacterium azadirachtae]
MARSPEQNRLARERSHEALLQAAIDVFAERGIEGATIAEITGRAGVAQGMVNYYFGGKEQLVEAVIDRWFAMLLGIARGEGMDAPAAPPAPAQDAPAEVRLAAIIDTALGMTAVALPLQRVVVALQQQPATRALFAAAEQRHIAGVAAAEDAVRGIFRERGADDPAMEEIMLRSVLDGIVGQRIIYGESYPLEAARRWVHRTYGLPEPVIPLPGTTMPVPDPGSEPRARASR